MTNSTLVFALLAVLCAAPIADAAPIVVTLDAYVGNAQTYSEAGLDLNGVGMNDLNSDVGLFDLNGGFSDYIDFTTTSGDLFNFLQVVFDHRHSGEIARFEAFDETNALVDTLTHTWGIPTPGADTLNFGSSFQNLSRVRFTVGSGHDSYLTQVTYEAVQVPEPALWTLFGTALAAYRRKRLNGRS